MGLTETSTLEQSYHHTQLAHVPKIAASCAFDVRDDETFAALPLLHLVNEGVNSLRAGMSNGQHGWSCSKVCSYLGYRLISYSGIPLVLNLISLLVCTVLSLLTLPTRCCCEGLNRWCVTRLQGSLGYTLQSFYDIFYDLDQILFCRPCR